MSENENYGSLEFLIQSKLEILDLFRKNIGNKETRIIAEMLKSNKCWKELIMMRNSIGKEGAGYLADALKVNTTLTSLDLEWNSIGKEDSKIIGIGLKRNMEVFEVLENSKKSLLGFSKEYSMCCFGNCHFKYQ